MDAPKKVRLKSSSNVGTEPGSPKSSSPGSALDRQRFRKKSVNMQLNAPDVEATVMTSKLFWKHATGDNVIPQNALLELLTTLYKPSEVENNHLMQWFDLTGDGQ